MDDDRSERVGKGSLETSRAQQDELDGAGCDDGVDAHDPHISFRPVERVNVSVRNLTITVSQRAVRLPWRKKTPMSTDEEQGNTVLKILDNISADMPAGQLVCIFGSSGSGKTSMLNAMAKRMRGQNLLISGETMFNDSAAPDTIRSAYVMQQDVLLPRLTVRETLRYAAELRLPSETSAEEREKVVEEVILQLGLKECANTPIGDSQHKGCSGGEKRRVSIGVQLLANPSVVFLDEPTTGLDATSAHQLIKTLKNLAKKGRTVITTLHQPRSEIWGLFDRIVLLARGNPIYSGSVSRVVAYFESLGYPLPPLVNPADFLIDLAAIDYRSPEAELASITRVNNLIASWREQEHNVLSQVSTKQETTPPLASVMPTEPQKTRRPEEINEPFSHAAATPIWRQISVLTRRSFKTTYRDPMGISGTMFLALGMSIACGWIFLQLGGTLSAIRSRQGSLYIAVSMHGYLMLLFETYRLCTGDIQVFDREHGEGVISPLAFLLSRRLAKLATEDIVMPFLFAVIYYFMVGFDHDVKQFFVFFVVILCMHYISICFATFSVSVSRVFSEAVLVCNLWYTMQSMACGYFIQASTMPVYVQWTKYICYIWYGFGAVTSNEFTDSFYDCPYEGGINNPACTEYDGNFILKSLDFPRNWIAVPIIINVAFAVFFYVAAGVFLLFFAQDINVASSKAKDDQDTSAGKEKIATPEDRKEKRKIDVVVEDYKLNLHKPRIFGKGGLDLEILKGVSSRFEAGKLNVIMGPSGSGKSSLLNLMARRLHSSLTTKYSSSGKMLLNGVEASDQVIRSLTSYVTQDDDALLPSLTVRETLRFSAALRLPRSMSAAEKEQRAEEVMLKLGLKDCADVLIGSEFKKGISGGQKRRVTIAVQILTEPIILLCDEPTSGLDAFTAASILGVLRGLADEGRTVICTIHQSRSDLFERFGNVLLLARGGYTIYSGPAPKMLPYFSAVGHDCLSATNPADFALDLITIDLQHESRERASREKVQKLIERFSHDEALSASETERPNSLPAELGQMRREMAPFHTAYRILLKRGVVNFKRQPSLVIARAIQVIGLGVVLGLYYAPLENDYYAVQTRLGYIQQLLPLYFVGMLQNIALYPTDRDVFYAEHDDRVYGPTVFFSVYTTLEIPFEVLTALLFSCIACLAIGLVRTVQMFFIVAANAVLITNCGESVGIIFNTLTTHSGFSVNAMSTVISIATVMSGIMSTDMPGLLKGINWVSPMKYAAQNLAPFSLQNVEFYCTAAQTLPEGSCPIRTGDDVLRLYKLDGIVPWHNLLALLATAFAYRAIAYGVLMLRRTHWGAAEK